MENFSQYLIPGSVGAVVALGLIKLTSRLIDWLIKREEIGGKENKDYRDHFINDFNRMKSRIADLEKKNEQKDKEYEELLDKYYDQVTENVRQETRIAQLEREVKTLRNRISQIEDRS